MKLSPSYSLGELVPLRKSLLALLATEAAPRIETEALEQASLPLVQLLIAAHQAARMSGKRLEITCAPEGALARALERMGFVCAENGALRIENGTWVSLSAA